MLFQVDSVPAGGELVAFFVAGEPKPGGSKRAVVNQYTGRAAIVEASNNVDWRNNVRTVAKRHWQTAPLDLPIRVEMTFCVVRPKLHYGAKGLKASAPRWPAKRPDLLKLARSTEDALTGIVYQDDSRIVQEYLDKVYADQPGVLIRVCHPEIEA